MANRVTWQLDLTPMLNQIVNLETREGFVRRATLTHVRYLSLELEGNQVDVPIEIVLDGDDPIAFTQIKSMAVGA